MTAEEAKLQNPLFPCPRDIMDRQVLISVSFFTFENRIGHGQILLDADVRDDVEELFALILKERFPIQSAIPVADPAFHWSDDLSMEANNTSAFNYRYIAGTSRLSRHATGRAIDINPFQNPFVKNESAHPSGAAYDTQKPGTIVADSFIARFLKNRGWVWGGEWNDVKDYQHFERP